METEPTGPSQSKGGWKLESTEPPELIHVNTYKGQAGKRQQINQTGCQGHKFKKIVHFPLNTTIENIRENTAVSDTWRIENRGD